jgi:DNA primase
MKRKDERLVIPAEKFQEIIEKTDIVEVIGRYVKLRRRGKVFRGRCPFCPDPDSSLVVSPAQKRFKCLNDRWGGDAITFLYKQPGIGTWQEAARILAEEAGIRLKATSHSKKRGGDA